MLQIVNVGFSLAEVTLTWDDQTKRRLQGRRGLESFEDQIFMVGVESGDEEVAFGEGYAAVSIRFVFRRLVCWSVDPTFVRSDVVDEAILADGAKHSLAVDGEISDAKR